MKKLYKVEVSGCVYVYADSISQAINLAEQGVIENESASFEYDVLDTDLDTINNDCWNGCIPYGEIHDRTCEQLVNEGKD